MRYALPEKHPALTTQYFTITACCLPVSTLFNKPVVQRVRSHVVSIYKKHYAYI